MNFSMKKMNFSFFSIFYHFFYGRKIVAQKSYLKGENGQWFYWALRGMAF